MPVPTTPLLDTLNSLVKVIKDDKTGTGITILRQFIHGPIADMLVKLTPNPYDNILLEILRSIVPES